MPCTYFNEKSLQKNYSDISLNSTSLWYQIGNKTNIFFGIRLELLYSLAIELKLSSIFRLLECISQFSLSKKTQLSNLYKMRAKKCANYQVPNIPINYYQKISKHIFYFRKFLKIIRNDNIYIFKTNFYLDIFFAYFRPSIIERRVHFWKKYDQCDFSD